MEVIKKVYKIISSALVTVRVHDNDTEEQCVQKAVEKLQRLSEDKYHFDIIEVESTVE
jgi:hypothetical protein